MAKKHQPSKPGYYTAHTLRDGTVLAASEDVRRPSPAQLRHSGEMDEDGVWQEIVSQFIKPTEWPERTWIVFQGAIAGRLNTRRALRDLVLPHLRTIETGLELAHKRLNKIEAQVARQRATRA